MDDAERIKRINQSVEYACAELQRMGETAQEAADRMLAFGKALGNEGRRRAAEIRESRKGWAKR